MENNVTLTKNQVVTAAANSLCLALFFVAGILAYAGAFWTIFSVVLATMSAYEAYTFGKAAYQAK